MQMRAVDIAQLAKRIEDCEAALAWLEEYGVTLTGRSEDKEAIFEMSLAFAGGVEGAEQAKKSMEGYARAMLPEIVQTAIRGCKNTIATDKQTIREAIE